MERINEIIIPAGIWNGYIWESNKIASEVKVFNNEYHDEMKLNSADNPFVIEAMIVVDRKMSYNIKYDGGIFSVFLVDIDKLDKEVNINNIRECKYIASFDDAPGLLMFKEYWRERLDDMCLDFATLVPCEFVFVGFDKNTQS
jgi:CRISPR type III-associated protein (TIGR04423 family)